MIRFELIRADRILNPILEHIIILFIAYLHDHILAMALIV
jgi:hypothetical protein